MVERQAPQSDPGKDEEEQSDKRQWIKPPAPRRRKDANTKANGRIKPAQRDKDELQPRRVISELQARRIVVVSYKEKQSGILGGIGRAG